MMKARTPTGSETIAAWLESLASTGPNPGGGAAAAVMAGMAAALTEMVTAYRHPSAPDGAKGGERARAAFAAAMRESAPAKADEDTRASTGFAEASNGRSGQERKTAMADASLAAAESSASVGRFAVGLLPALRELAEDTPDLLLADVGVAAVTLAASTRAAALNITADLRLAGRAGAERTDMVEALTELEGVAAELDAIARSIHGRLAG